MTADVLIFCILAFLTLASALTVVLIKNPIYSALALAMTMIGISGLFVTLQAYFIAGVQLIVYAGAVLVLFVMVLMLFDLKKELQTFARGKVSGFFKIISVGLLAGLVTGAIMMNKGPELMVENTTVDQTKKLGQILFSQYLFGFEALGVLLLVVAVGAVALSRSKGGTHAKH